MSDSLAGWAQDNAELNALREANLRLQQALTQTKARTERLVEAAFQGARDAMLGFGPLTEVPAPRKDTRKGQEAALWHLTDWQGGKRTVSYDRTVMTERVRAFCQKASKITDIQRADHPVNECTIMFGGDMVEGVQIFPQQPFEIDATLFEQWLSVSLLEVEVIRFALSIYKKVNVVSEWGNHGRVGSKRSTIPSSDNFDRMTYELARQTLAGESRLTWMDGAEDIQRVEMGNYRALLIHGDEVGRSGFASPTTLIQHVNRWKSGAYDWDFHDVYMGHFHSHAEWPMANGVGSLYQTGSTESDNRYARDTMASSSAPSQRLHFVDPDRGRVTSVYRVFLG